MATPAIEENIERAFRHVSTGWLPVQQSVLQKVRSQLKQGAYFKNKPLLAEDLKEDFALYMYCLRELSATVQRESEQSPFSRSLPNTKLSPREIFEKADLETLEQILTRPDSEISTHSLSNMNELQALRFRESMLSATAAEVLAGKNQLNPEDGFSCGLLRQLGLTLIAWNYPRVYTRAMESITPAEGLDFQLQKVLGFSPSLLGLTFAQRWNLSDDILMALGERKRKAAPTTVDSDEQKAKQVGEMLSKICEVSEALARANDPEHYPTALHDWEEAQEAIASQLGPNGLQTILEKAKEHCKEYLRLTPEMQDFTESAGIKERIVDSRFAVSKLEKNVHLKSCPAAVKEKITKLYYQLKPNKILKKNIQTLVFEVVPSAGFRRGCIYMLDPASRVLAPSIKIGDLSADRARPIKLSSALSHFDLVSSAFSLKSPLKEEGSSVAGQRVTMIACSLGQNAAMGVFYLETSDDFINEIGPDPMPVFRALRQTLADCLNLI